MQQPTGARILSDKECGFAGLTPEEVPPAATTNLF